MDNKTEKTPKTTKTSNRPITIYTLIILSLMVAAVLMHRINFSSDFDGKTKTKQIQTVSSIPQVDPAEVKQYIEDANEAISKYENTCDLIDQELNSYISNDLNGEYTVVYNAIPGIANKFCGHKYIVEKIRHCGKNESAEKKLEEEIKNAIYNPCNNANNAVAEKIVEIAQKYEDASYTLKTELGCVNNYPSLGANFEIEMPNLDYSVDETKANISEFNKSVKWLGVSVVAEAIFIRSTANALIRAGVKVAAKLGVSAGLTLVDGPLPFGDILAIGGLVWTGYDIYQIEVAVPKKFKQQITELVNQNKKQMNDCASEFASTQKSKREQMINKFENELKRLEEKYIMDIEMDNQ